MCVAAHLQEYLLSATPINDRFCGFSSLRLTLSTCSGSPPSSCASDPGESSRVVLFRSVFATSSNSNSARGKRNVPDEKRQRRRRGRRRGSSSCCGIVAFAAASSRRPPPGGGGGYCSSSSCRRIDGDGDGIRSSSSSTSTSTSTSTSNSNSSKQQFAGNCVEQFVLGKYDGGDGGDDSLCRGPREHQQQ